LAGAIISIALNPVAFHVSNMMLSFAGRSKKLSSIFNVSDQDLSHLRRGENKALRDNVILVGYGQTGARIAQSILDLHVDLVTIESNREKVDTLRSGGRHAIAGDATHPETLQAAAIEKAIAIIITLPNPFEARRVLETALTLNPKIKILVHAHNETEAGFYEKQHVHLAVTGQREVARRIASFIHEMQNK
jgi:CPA2 family monovalent cation:H+ antiporter-2